MMSTSENKQIVTEFFDHFSAGRKEQALAMIADDGTWWAPGVGVMKKSQFGQVMSFMEKKVMKGPIRITMKRVTEEDDRVAVEAESDGDVVNGKHYHNTYHFLIVIGGGKIREVKEYNDTRYAAEVFGDLLPSA